jgi:hypothetical protein
MGKLSLLFRSLSVNNARGIRRKRGFCCNDLAQVNIIYGSNGVGKSTAGLALMALLSPADGKLGEGCDISGVIELGQQTYDLSVDGKVGKAFSGSEASDYPSFNSTDQLTRYRLALDELIQSDDVEFAAIIAKETRGGFDLEEIVSRRKYTLRPITPGSRQTQLETQRTHCAELRRKQEALDKWEMSLSEKEQKKLALIATHEELPVIKAVRHIRELQLERTKTLNHLSQFPDVMDCLSGTDSEFLTEKEASRDAARAKGQELQKKIDELETEIVSDGKLELAEQSEIDRMKMKHAAYLVFVDKRRDLQKTISATTAEADACLEGFTKSVSDEVAEQFDGLGWLKIENLWEQEIQYRGQRDAVQSLVEVFQEDFDTSRFEESLLQIRQDVDSLHQWLSTPSGADLGGTKFYNDIPLLSMVGLAVLTCILAVAVHVGWLGLLSIPLALATWYVKARKAKNGSIHREAIQRQCDADPDMDVWDEINVRAMVEAKYQERGELTAQIEKARHADAARLRLKEVTRHHNDAIADIKKWAASLDLVWDESGPIHFVNVFRAINRRNVLRSKLDGLHGELEQIDSDISQSFQEMTSVFEGWGHSVENSADNLLPDIVKIEQVLRVRRERKKELDHQRTLDKTQQGILQACNTDISKVYKRLGIEDGVVDDVVELENRLDSYSSLVKKLNNQDMRISDEEIQAKIIEGALDWSEAELHTKEEYAAQAEGELNELREQIATNKGKISAAGTSRELSEALAHAEGVEQDLIEDRESAFNRIVGQTLVDWLAEQSTNDQTSNVLKEARMMLDKITTGELALEVSLTGKEEFFVTVGDERRGVNELSVGERVQVLLSVRMAFLDHTELAVLPLVLDETLGTSDDDRAHDIINSVLKVASLGRQVFYFTAQTDEVAKWKLLLKEYPKLESRFIDLDAQLDDSIARKIPQAEAFTLAATIDPPGECSHQEFGKKLGVLRPSLVPYVPEKLHLWYLIEDMELLYACIKTRVVTWGSLQRAVRDNASGVPFINKEQYSTIESRAAVVTTAVNQWSVGRAASVTREDLREGGVSDVFMDRIWDVAVRVEYCGLSLIKELRVFRPKQWSEGKTDNLEEYLFRVEKIDMADRSTPDEIYSKAALELQSQGDRLESNEEWLQWVLENILRA